MAGVCPPRDGHSSGPRVATRLVRPTRAARRQRALPVTGKPATDVPPLFGLAPGGVCPATPVTRRAVRSYRTFSPLPGTHPGRFDLCGTFPGVAPAGRYPAPLLHGARTFLCRSSRGRQRPSGRLVGPRKSLLPRLSSPGSGVPAQRFQLVENYREIGPAWLRLRTAN